MQVETFRKFRKKSARVGYALTAGMVAFSGGISMYGGGLAQVCATEEAVVPESLESLSAALSAATAEYDQALALQTEKQLAYDNAKLAASAADTMAMEAFQTAAVSARSAADTAKANRDLTKAQYEEAVLEAASLSSQAEAKKQEISALTYTEEGLPAEPEVYQGLQAELDTLNTRKASQEAVVAWLESELADHEIRVSTTEAAAAELEGITYQGTDTVSVVSPDYQYLNDAVASYQAALDAADTAASELYAAQQAFSGKAAALVLAQAAYDEAAAAAESGEAFSEDPASGDPSSDDPASGDPSSEDPASSDLASESSDVISPSSEDASQQGGADPSQTSAEETLPSSPEASAQPSSEAQGQSVTPVPVQPAASQPATGQPAASQPATGQPASSGFVSKAQQNVVLSASPDSGAGEAGETEEESSSETRKESPKTGDSRMLRVGSLLTGLILSGYMMVRLTGQLSSNSAHRS